MPLGEPVRGQPPHWRPGAHVDAAAVLGGDEPFGFQQPQRAADRHPGHAIVADQLGLGGQLVALLQPAPADRLAQVVGYLFVDGTITCRVDSLGEHLRAHSRDSSTRAHVYDCQVTQG